MIILGMIFMAVIFVIVGGVLKPKPQLPEHEEMIERIVYRRKITRLCPRHIALLKPKAALLDSDNCQECGKGSA